jgi:hypothetical protein
LPTLAITTSANAKLVQALNYQLFNLFSKKHYSTDMGQEVHDATHAMF